MIEGSWIFWEAGGYHSLLLARKELCLREEKKQIQIVTFTCVVFLTVMQHKSDYFSLVVLDVL